MHHHMWCRTSKGGTLQKLRVSLSSPWVIMVTVSYVRCCFIGCFLGQVFQKTWFLSGISLIVHNQNINKRTWLTLTIIMVMKWDTYGFHKVPPFDVLHHIYWYTMVGTLSLLGPTFDLVFVWLQDGGFVICQGFKDFKYLVGLMWKDRP